MLVPAMCYVYGISIVVIDVNVHTVSSPVIVMVLAMCVYLFVMITCFVMEMCTTVTMLTILLSKLTCRLHYNNI